jgi:proteasome accessory factor A
VKAIKEASHDPTCRVRLQLDDGKKLSAVEIQKEFLEMALAYTSSRSVDVVTKDVIARWQHVLECLSRDPMELHEKIDWVMKKAMIESFMQRKQLDWDSPQVGMLDLQYHDLRPDKGLYYLLERQGRAERIVTDEEIAAAVHNPPRDTRAYFRGECLRRYGSAVFGVNWDAISFGVNGEPIKRILMAEPLKGTKVYVEDLLTSSPTAADLVRNLRT